MTPQGFTAIRDGIKARAAPRRPGPRRASPRGCKARAPHGRRVPGGQRTLVKEHRLATVCEEAKCPNIGECWNAGTATIMLMGAVCTRACRFCSVDTGNPRGWLDARGAGERGAHRRADEAQVRRADLGRTATTCADGGAAHYAACVRAIKQRNPAHRGRGADAGLPGRAGGRRDRGRFGPRGVRAEHRDGAAPDPPGARSARRLRADAARCWRMPSATGPRCSPRAA